MRGRVLAVSLVVVVGACTTQTAPPRGSLPEIEAVVPPPLTCAFTVGPAQGVVVRSTLPGTAAEGMLRAGDIIVAMDGGAIRDQDQLVEFMAGTQVGQQVEIEIIREDDRQTVDLILGEGVEDGSTPMIGVTIGTSAITSDSPNSRAKSRVRE